MKFIQKWIDSANLHKTGHTRHLDSKFDLTKEYSIGATLGKYEYEVVGHMLLDRSQKAGHFVAMPLNSRYWDSKRKENTIYNSCLSSGSVGPMLEKGFLVSETLSSGVKVFSPSYKMALRMFKRDRSGNEPKMRDFSEIQHITSVGKLVNAMYID